MRTFTQQQDRGHGNHPSSRQWSGPGIQSHKVDPILQLQRAVGNQAVQLLLQVQEEGQVPFANTWTQVNQIKSWPPSDLQREAPAGETGAVATARDDAKVQEHIDDALAQNPTVGRAFRSLQSRRCVPESCGDENLAAAEHYMFARSVVQDFLLPPEIMAPIMAGLIGGYAIVKLLHLMPSLCPDICPVTPPSTFQVGWAIKGVEDGLIFGSIPQSPLQSHSVEQPSPYKKS